MAIKVNEEDDDEKRNHVQSVASKNKENLPPISDLSDIYWLLIYNHKKILIAYIGKSTGTIYLHSF